jgi:hypothetical protein
MTMLKIIRSVIVALCVLGVVQVIARTFEG